MNWFQIVFLREDSQAVHKNSTQTRRCELISNCIFTWGFTSVTWLDSTNMMLWIDFKLYFYVRIHKNMFCPVCCFGVVNWFQIVFLREASQDVNCVKHIDSCCELISNCIFTWGFTSSTPATVSVSVLWIDFKLYFYVRIHKIAVRHFHLFIVVNWFQIVFLREDSQGCPQIL